MRTQGLEICGDQFCIVKHTKRSQKSQKTGSAATAVIPVRTLKYRYLHYICHIPKLVALQPRANVSSWPYVLPLNMWHDLCFHVWRNKCGERSALPTDIGSHLKMDGWKTSFLFVLGARQIFTGELWVSGKGRRNMIFHIFEGKKFQGLDTIDLFSIGELYIYRMIILVDLDMSNICIYISIYSLQKICLFWSSRHVNWDMFKRPASIGADHFGSNQGPCGPVA